MSVSATATATGSSLTLASLAPKALSLFAAKPTSLSFSSSPLRAGLVCVASLGFRAVSPSSRVVAKVALSSEYDQDEEVLGGDEDDEGSFSEDLKLFVGNLPWSVDSARLAGLFEKVGNVEMVEVIYDKATGRSRGFGFVTMSSIDEVEAAAQQFNGYELEGRALRVNHGPPPPRQEDSFRRGGERGGSRGGYGGGGGGGYGGSGGGGGRSVEGGSQVYVGNLSWNVDNSALENLFGEQGNILEAKVVYDRDSGRSRGFGFVTYDSADGANNAIDSLNGADLDGRQIRVTHAEARQQRRSF